jgi:hypothetical protein
MIRDYRENVNNIDELVTGLTLKARRSINSLNKKIVIGCGWLSPHQKEILKHFSIGSVMQLQPIVKF